MADTIIQSIYASELVIDDAFVEASGSASRVDLTAALAVPTDAAEVAQATADAAVAKSDVQVFTQRVDLKSTATGFTYSFRPQFAGTLVDSYLLLDGATTTVGACSAAVTVSGAAVTGGAMGPIGVGEPAGATFGGAITAGGAFAANSTVKVTVTSANTAVTFGGVSLGYTRS